MNREKILQEVFDKIDNDKLNSVIRTHKKTAQEDLERSYNIDSPVSGRAILIKDNILQKGNITSAGSKMLENFIAPYDSTVVKKLKEKGMIIVGSANMDEFAMGSSNETSYFGPVKNYWDNERTSGGSSGGSANAVASGLVDFSLGTDTGGSVRQPASLTGVIGLKPTYGRVSRYGVIAFGSSLDQVGIFANNAKDASLILETIAGYDPLDSTSSKEPVKQYSKDIDKDIKGVRIALIEEIKDSYDQKTLKIFEDLGAVFIWVSMPNLKYSIPTYYIISSAEAASNLSRFDGVKYGYKAETDDIESMYTKTRTEGFGDEVKRRIMIGNYVLSASSYNVYYKKASQIRRLIQNDFINVFEKADVILTPTTPTTAFKLGEKMTDPVQMYLADIYTVSINLAGVPAISVPSKLENGLPIGIQLIGNFYQEDLLLNISHVFEKKRGKL